MFAVFFIYLAVCPVLLNAFYVPGVAPTDFFKGDPVEIKVIFLILTSMFLSME